MFELLYISTAAALFSVPHLFIRFHIKKLILINITYFRLSKQSVYKRLTTIMLPLAHVGLTGTANKYKKNPLGPNLKL